jgi:2-oxoadipate dehydrogenase E1 component
MLVDQNTESVVVPLNAAISPDLGRLELANSKTVDASASIVNIYCLGSLSELAVLGVSQNRGRGCLDSVLTVSQFEFGMSWERPNILPIWEAQVRVSPCCYL